MKTKKVKKTLSKRQLEKVASGTAKFKAGKALDETVNGDE